jgi:arginine decarboxylase
MDKYILNSSIGYGTSELTSFDNALLNCKIANYNLVKVSSILPARCREVEKVDIPEGSVIFTAYASLSSNKTGQLMSAAVGVGLPKDKEKIGVIMECSGFCTRQNTEEKLKSMIKEAMQTRGYEIEHIIFKSTEATVSTNEYVTVFASLSMW